MLSARELTELTIFVGDGLRADTTLIVDLITFIGDELAAVIFVWGRPIDLTEVSDEGVVPGDTFSEISLTENKV